MNSLRTTRAELRKLTSTKMPLTFLIVLVAIGAATAIAVAFGTDMDGSKTFISTAADQQSLMAFAANALVIAGLFGAVAVAREYGHRTVVLTFLTAPRRPRAVLAQLAAASIAGAVLGFVGAGISAGSVAAGLAATDYGFMVSTAGVAQVLAASALAGAAGAVLGAGIGAFVRNTGGAVTATILTLVIVPPLAVQMVGEAASWMPASLANVVSGIDGATGIPAAIAAIGLWAMVPAAIGLVTVSRRDVV
jgi:ABC-type transport system involved in multi-copper enzyme maturation permease subunit